MQHMQSIQHWEPEEPEYDGQLELPGIALDKSDDLLVSLGELEEELERARLTLEETELLRRFRRTSAENRRMVLQILGG
ncbi:hypothetical protein [Marinobacter subterrani]|uniref:Uncharacterized protein n=1 Tax=Marinobacter subterrani TaxID=1658765 RepID=A0A0J7M0M3_9GAMM|nr:hypothetical protein [Marinobacter subterrani]KMQ74650.1 hypothetical protein Msub_10836 [Marinobacter subterrani]